MKKKGQEEMVGLVVIMVLVAIVFLVLLGIFLRQKPAERADSAEVAQFLDALEEQTTDCSLDGFSYLNVRRAINECNQDKLCRNGKKVCEVLGTTLKDLTESAWNFNEDSVTKGYEYQLTYRVGESAPRELPFSLPTSRPCGATVRGADKDFPSQGGGVITIVLEICLD